MSLPRSNQRITLRRLSEYDLRAFQSYRQCEELSKYQGWTPQPDSESLNFLKEMSTIEMYQPQKWAQLGIIEGNIDGKLIGDVGICVSEDNLGAELGFTLSKESHGKGFGTSAVSEAITMLFEDTMINYINSVTDARNLPSIRLLERVGMKVISEDRALFRGEECTEFTYQIKRCDWLIN